METLDYCNLLGIHPALPPRQCDVDTPNMKEFIPDCHYWHRSGYILYIGSPVLDSYINIFLVIPTVSNSAKLTIPIRFYKLSSAVSFIFIDLSCPSDKLEKVQIG